MQFAQNNCEHETKQPDFHCRLFILKDNNTSEVDSGLLAGLQNCCRRMLLAFFRPPSWGCLVNTPCWLSVGCTPKGSAVRAGAHSFCGSTLILDYFLFIAAVSPFPIKLLVEKEADYFFCFYFRTNEYALSHYIHQDYLDPCEVCRIQKTHWGCPSKGSSVAHIRSSVVVKKTFGSV